ncbi:hypothetical protein CIK74_00495 [Glutamicibacter sp. BW77]|nr:hypothetical protein CIK74_00495 [Glutamicibacter sp. BW77]
MESFFITQIWGRGREVTLKPSAQELKESWAVAYPYLEEFKGHKHWGRLISPYYEETPGAFPYEPMEFYDLASESVAEHIRKHPKKPAGYPYLEDSNDQ